MSYTVQKLISIAEAEVGYLEKASNSNLDSKTGNAGRANWTKYARDLANAGYYNGNKNGYAWCDVFVDWCHWIASNKDSKEAQRVICQTGAYGAGCVYSADYYRAKGRYSKEPKVGDQIFFGNTGDEYHTGIVYKVDGSRVYTIEGNTSSDSGVVDNGGGVFKKSYNRSYYEINGYGHPYYEGEIPSSVEEKDDLLSVGDTGSAVKKLQQDLISLGYSCGHYGADGDFGASTKQAVIKFQREHGLDADGIAGPLTLSAIENELKEQKNPSKIENYSRSQFITDVQRATGCSLVDGIYGPITLGRTITVSRYKNATHTVVKPIQKRLAALGFSVGEIDGVAGSKFDTAVKSFQRKYGCVVDGELTAGEKTWQKILTV